MPDASKTMRHDGAWHAYRLRWKRRRFLFRIWRKRHQLRIATDRTCQINSGSVLAFVTVRNEIVRLPNFLEHYRKLGIDHFLFVDNDSDDGTAAFLHAQPDVSVWTTKHSYKLARFGMDWLGWLQCRYGNGHWCLTIDADELLVYPECESRDLQKLTAWLDERGIASFGAMLIDMYPKGPLNEVNYQPGDDPLRILSWFDADTYRDQIHDYYSNLWIQGGARERVFFAKDPARAPTLNKTPLVKWHWRYAYVSSTHQILPTRLHDVFDFKANSKTSGALLHTKFLPVVAEKSKEEMNRLQHFENSSLYEDYHQRLTENPTLWYEGACHYDNPSQLVALGLMSKGDWV